MGSGRPGDRSYTTHRAIGLGINVALDMTDVPDRGFRSVLRFIWHTPFRFVAGLCRMFTMTAERRPRPRLPQSVSTCDKELKGESTVEHPEMRVLP